jgi:hypothetical protein
MILWIEDRKIRISCFIATTDERGEGEGEGEGGLHSWLVVVVFEFVSDNANSRTRDSHVGRTGCLSVVE